MQGYFASRERKEERKGVLIESVGGRAGMWKRTSFIDSNFSGKQGQEHLLRGREPEDNNALLQHCQGWESDLARTRKTLTEASESSDESADPEFTVMPNGGGFMFFFLQEG